MPFLTLKQTNFLQENLSNILKCNNDTLQESINKTKNLLDTVSTNKSDEFSKLLQSIKDNINTYETSKNNRDNLYETLSLEVFENVLLQLEKNIIDAQFDSNYSTYIDALKNIQDRYNRPLDVPFTAKERIALCKELNNLFDTLKEKLKQDEKNSHPIFSIIANVQNSNLRPEINYELENSLEQLDCALRDLNVFVYESISKSINNKLENGKLPEYFVEYANSLHEAKEQYQQNRNFDEWKETSIEILTDALRNPEINKHQNFVLKWIGDLLEFFQCKSLLKMFNNIFPTNEKKFVNESIRFFGEKAEEIEDPARILFDELPGTAVYD